MVSQYVSVMFHASFSTFNVPQETQMKMRRSISRIPIPSCEAKTQCNLGLSVIDEKILRENLAKMRKLYEDNYKKVKL